MAKSTQTNRRRSTSNNAPSGRRGDGSVGGPRAQFPQSQSVTGQVIGAIFALCAFSVSILAGLVAGNSSSSVVGRALLAMIVCWPVGLAVGYVCQRVLTEHMKAHAQANPLPELAEQHNADEAVAVETHESSDTEEPLVV